jgi:hypothetical protein
MSFLSVGNLEKTHKKEEKSNIYSVFIWKLNSCADKQHKLLYEISCDKIGGFSVEIPLRNILLLYIQKYLTGYMLLAIKIVTGYMTLYKQLLEYITQAAMIIF